MVGRILGGGGGQTHFQIGTQVMNLGKAALGHGGNDGGIAVIQFQRVFGHKAQQRLAHRGRAQSQLGGERPQDKTFPRAVTAADQPAAHMVIGFLAQCATRELFRLACGE